MTTMVQAASATTYPGRGIIAGKTQDGEKAFLAYFIMGRSVNSRNRIFVEQEGGIRTEAFDPSRMVDPSLIIYNPVRTLGKKIIVTNGDQTDTIYDGLRCGGTFAGALRTRAFEPDAPNFTPRISLVADFAHGYKTAFSILKAADAHGERCLRCFYEYEGFDAGEGRFLHTYKQDGDPIPSFEGEPEVLAIEGDAESLTEALWNALDANNRVSLWTMLVDLKTGEKKTTIINRNV